jgi:hypothetical protein
MLDARFLRAALSWWRWAGATLLCAAFVLAQAFPTVRAALALESALPAWLFGAWPLTYAAAVQARERLVRRGFSLLRAICIVHGVAVMACLGACSVLEISAAYALLLLLPACWGQLFPKSGLVLASLVFAPLALRLAAVASASPRSLLVAAVVGILVGGLYWAFSRRRVAIQALERRANLREALGTRSATEAASLLTAMRLHEGLSGALALARVRAEQGSSEATVDVGRTLAHQTRATFARLLADPSTSDLGAELARFAEQVGVRLELELSARVDASDPVGRDLLELLLELIANQARHGAKADLAVMVRVTPRKLLARVHASGAGPNPARAGRGLRNIALRVAARGGSLTRGDTPDGWMIAIALPRSPGWRPSLWLIELLLHGAPPMVAWLQTRDPIVTLILALPSAFLAFVQVANGQRVVAVLERHRRAEEAEITAASHPSRRLVGEALRPGLEALERAVAGRDADGVRAALLDLEQRFVDLIWAFEAPHEASELEALLSEFARTLGVAYDLCLETVDSSALFRARRRLRGAAYPARVSGAARGGAPPPQLPIGS